MLTHYTQVPLELNHASHVLLVLSQAQQGKRSASLVLRECPKEKSRQITVAEWALKCLKKLLISVVVIVIVAIVIAIAILLLLMLVLLLLLLLSLLLFLFLCYTCRWRYPMSFNKVFS